MAGRGDRRERAGRRHPGHRAVELPALPGRPGGRPEPGARQRDPAQARRAQPADRRWRSRSASTTPACPRASTPTSSWPSPTSSRSSRTRSCRASPSPAASGPAAPSASLAGKHLKKSVLELGGSDPFIVLDTEDLGRTVKAATMGRMQNTGQACIAAKRLIVPEDIYEPFVEGLQAGVLHLLPRRPERPVDVAGAAVQRAGGPGPARADPGRRRQGRDRGHRRRPSRPRGRLRRADDPHRRHPGHAGLPRGAVRAGRRRLQGRERGRGGRAGQQHRLTASAPPSSPATSTRPGRWPTGSRPAWCSSTSRPAPPPSCPSAA